MEQKNTHSLLLVFLLFALSSLAFISVVLQNRAFASSAPVTCAPVLRPAATSVERKAPTPAAAIKTTSASRSSAS